MIRAVLSLALVAATACSGPSAPVPTGFGAEDRCASGPRIGGTTQMGVGNTDRRGDRVITDVDATLTMSGRTGGGCVGAAYDLDDR